MINLLRSKLEVRDMRETMVTGGQLPADITDRSPMSFPCGRESKVCFLLLNFILIFEDSPKADALHRPIKGVDLRYMYRNTTPCSYVV